MPKLPVIDWTPEFAGGFTFYDCQEEERLEYTDISELLIARVQDGYIDLDEALKTNEVIEVKAFATMKFDRPSSRLSEYIEQIDEQDGMGDPDGDHESLSDDEYEELKALESKLIDRLCELYEPWGCEQVATIKVPFREWWATLTDDERDGLK
jgi:hypothetical protein